ncbi:MAG TPA: VWA domain-containing protein [Acidobacteriaceae bacterium]|jgi:VWFA-related protein|nr:VWA domain-containing protein [Acidobacteriaceae bacterium]
MLRRTGFFSLVIFSLCAVGFGQSAPANGSAPATQAPQKPVTTIKTNARLVVLDVVVKDGRGHPMHGLKASDFTVMENNTPQTVGHFEEHVALTPADAMRIPEMPKMPPGIYTNYSPAPASGVVNVVLLDTLNTPLADQAFVRQQLSSYLKTLQPGTRLAIFGLTQRLLLLQGFTSDPELLKAVLAKNKGSASPLLDDAVGGGGVQNSMSDNMEDAGMDPEIVANVQQFEAQTQSFQLQLRAKYTLDAMNQLARYLSIIPGRKNLIWFSGSFPVNIMPDTTGTLPDPFAVMADSEDEFRETVTMLAAAQVAVYPVDARGLFNSQVFSAATSRNYGGPKGAARMQQDQNKFFTQTAEEQGTMRDMAAATGGHAFVNTNGLAAAVATAIEEGSNFYTLSYVPTNSAEDGRLRKLKVRVNQPGMALAYRQGYYADRPGSPEKTTSRIDAAIISGNGLVGRDALYLAMMRGAPVPTEIMMNVGVVPITPKGQTEEKLADGNTPVGKLQGPYRRYSVNYVVNPSDLNFVRTADEKVHCDVDLVIVVYTPTGQLINEVQGHVHIAAPLEDVRKAAANGMFWHEEISTPAKGEYFLRIIVRDEHKNRYGAVEMATSEVRNVVGLKPPADASGAAK